MPANAVDGDPETRWSAEGTDGSVWLQLDCGEAVGVAGLQLSVYKGDERNNIFRIDGSTDGSTWLQLSGELQSSGVSTDPEFIIFDAPSQVRYVRYVGFGNSGSAWNSVTEIAVVHPSDPTPTPPIVPTATPTATPTLPPLPDPLPTSELTSVPAISCTVEVDTTSDLEAATGYSIRPGTTVCLLDGTYSDVELEVGGNGTANRPITVAAKNPGAVIINGESQLRMGGTHIVVQGLTFKGGNSASSDLIQTRGQSNEPCNYCRITELTVVDWDQSFAESNRWLLIYGQHNRVDHSWFSGKPTRGALLTVDRGGNSEPDYAQIDHNYFGDRLPFSGGEFPDGSANEFEGIRIGTSDTQAFPSFSRVEYNYFERMRGEAEIISNKSGSNVISHNTIRSSYGSLVNRHGSGSVISNNFIFGDGYGMSGGIRISGANHQVTNNYIEGCTFTGSTFNGGIVLTRTDGSQATSGYQQVENVLIAHNTIVNCTDSIKLDGGRSSSSALAEDVHIVNNVVVDAVGPVIVGQIPPTTTFGGNYVDGNSLGLSTAPAGVTFGDPLFAVGADGLVRPTGASPVIDGGVSDYGSFPAVAIDMEGQSRVNPDAGADEVSNETATARPLTTTDVGPKNYRP